MVSTGESPHLRGSGVGTWASTFAFSPQGVCAAAEDTGPDAGQRLLRPLHLGAGVSLPHLVPLCRASLTARLVETKP